MKQRFPLQVLAGFTGSLLLLAACGSNKSTDTVQTPTTDPTADPSAVQLYGAKVATTISSLPACDKSNVGQLYYILADNTFEFCATDGYQIIALAGKDGTNGTDGKTGGTGTDGINGFNGTNGTDGKTGGTGTDGINGTNGSSCSVVVNTDSTRTISCTDGTKATVQNGGSCTVKDNGDNSYDLGCGGTTVTVHDGVDGINGTNGKDGLDGATGAAVHVPDLLLWSVNDSKVLIDETVTFNVSLMTDAAGSLDIKHFLWDFNGDGTWDKDNATGAKETYQYTDAGIYKAYLKLVDSQGASDIDSIEIVVTAPPSSSSSVEASSSGISYGTLTDARDGQDYPTVTIGTQTWMAQNLNYSGDNGAGERTYTKGWCYGVGSTPSVIADTAMHQESTTCDGGYGRLYHWADAMDISSNFLTTTATGVATNRTTNALVSGSANNRGLCPVGWHVPSTTEWDALATFIRTDKSVTSDNEGKYLKAVVNPDPNSWNSATYNVQDPYGFSALPAGYRSNDGSWYGRTNIAYFWSASEYNASYAGNRYLYFNYAYLNAYDNNKYYGFSLRCSRD